MYRPVPTLTHLQFAAIATIRQHGTMSGRQLREGLAAHGITLSGPAFYQFMARLSEAGLVEVDRRTEPQGGLAVKETYYSLTEEGTEVFQRSLDFYLELGNPETKDHETMSMTHWIKDR